MGFPRRCRPAQAGFTLVELVLTVSLILLLFGAAVLNFGSFQRGSALDEGLGQLEYLFRLARASASSSGRLVRLSFQEELPIGGTNGSPISPGIQATWEPDPLQAPGTFLILTEAAPLVERLNELIRIQPVQSPETVLAELPLLESGSRSEADLPAAASSTNPPAIRFYPDGSSDSSDLLVVSTDPDDARRVRVRLSGLVGTVRRQWLGPEDLPGDPTGDPFPESGQPPSTPSALPTRNPVGSPPRSP